MTYVDFDALKCRPLEGIVADWGYVRDPAASTRTNPVLRAPGQAKLVTKLCPNGHRVYFSALDSDDHGTAIDFLLRRGLSFAEIRTRYGTPAGTSRDFRRHWHAALPDPGAGLAGRLRHPPGDARRRPPADPPRPQRSRPLRPP